MHRLSFLLLTACLFVSGAAPAAESPHYLEARQRYEKKEYLLAMLAAERAVREDGENARHRYLYGAVLAELKQFRMRKPNCERRWPWKAKTRKSFTSWDGFYWNSRRQASSVEA